MGDEGGNWVEFGFGLESVIRDVNFIFFSVDEICCYYLFFFSVFGEIVYKV